MPRLKKGASPKPLKAPGMGTRHSHVTCLVCGGRLSRKWLASVASRPRRWGFEMECLGRRVNRKVRDIPIVGAPPAEVKAWLPGYADALATLVALTLAELLEAGWDLGDLTRLARAMRTRGLLERVVEQVYVQVPREPYGNAKVKNFAMGKPVAYGVPRANVASFTMGEPVGRQSAARPAPSRANVAKFTMGEPVSQATKLSTPRPNAEPRANVASFTMGEPVSQATKPSTPRPNIVPRATAPSFAMGEPIDIEWETKRK